MVNRINYARTRVFRDKLENKTGFCQKYPKYHTLFHIYEKILRNRWKIVTQVHHIYQYCW
jgi:hypothetical protein